MIAEGIRLLKELINLPIVLRKSTLLVYGKGPVVRRVRVRLQLY